MARTESLLIGEELFKSLAPVSGSLDFQYVWPHILATQDKWIQPTIGQKLYEKLMTDIESGAITGDYLTLLEDYVARTVVWFTCYAGMPFWGVKVVNSGIIQRVVDDGNPLDFNDISKIAEQCRDQGEFYKERLIRYLCANSELFPEYQSTDEGEMSPDSTNYECGLNLDEGRTKKWYL